MIVDLDNVLYVVDEDTHEHRVKSIDVINKTVTTIDNEVYEYSTNPLTIVIKKLV